MPFDENGKRVSWNSGLTKETDSRLKKMSESFKGRPGYMQGKTHSEETKKKLRDINLGKTHSEETKKNISEKKKGVRNSKSTEFKKGHKLNLGRKHKEESIKKMSEVKKGKKQDPEVVKLRADSNRGKKRSPEFCKQLSERVKKEYSSGNRVNPNKGKNLSEEHKKKIGLGNKKYVGELATNWQGGKSFEPYSTDFNNQLKEKIRERDNHTCQVCGLSGRVVHHIDYDKKNSDEDNLITLCQSCHGKTNFDREHWGRFFND